MGRLFFLGLLAAVSVVSLARPWVGVVCAYFVAILTPQAVWYWDFQDIRPVYWVLLPTLIGVLVGLLRSQYDLSILKQKRVLYMLLLWWCFIWSYFLGPYTDAGGPWRFSDPSLILSTLNKILLLYFIATLCLDSVEKLKALIYVIAISAVYLTYWANDRYLSGHVIGRMGGPVDINGIGIYADENSFAMLFVVAQPFLWYLGVSFKNRILKYGCWLIIPFAWHAVFLTASRGGLVGIAATTALMGLRSRNKLFGLLLLPAFIFVYNWQAGDLMKSRADTIGEFRTEESAATRLEAWAAATKMIAAHPLTGVGLASFGPAFPDYSDKHPREAHNTFFQITAESGVLAGAMYALLVVTSLTALWRNGGRFRREKADMRTNFVYLANEITLVALFGLAICSLFLSLQVFEIFYCLIAIVNSIIYISNKGTSLAGGTERAAPTRPRRLSYPLGPIHRRWPRHNSLQKKQTGVHQ